MNCQKCGNIIAKNAKFCGKCGNKIPRCPQCGEIVQAGVKFCLKDGTRIPDEVPELLPEKKVLQEENMPTAPKKITIDSRGRVARFCKKCGKPCEEEMSICRACSRKDKKKSGSGVVIAVIFSLLLLAIGGMVAWLIMNGELPFGSKSPTISEDTSAFPSNNEESEPQKEPDEDMSGELNENEESKIEGEEAKEEEIEYVEADKEAFWGIWCVTSDDLETVEKVKQELENDNYKAAIINPAEWGGLKILQSMLLRQENIATKMMHKKLFPRFIKDMSLLMLGILENGWK